VLSDKARFHGKPFPPAAYICPGAPPVVYVPHTLVDRVLVTKKYPEDFLAFVMGHELGHRANDFSSDGCQLAAFQRPGKGRNEESLADARSAFFTSIAGYSTRLLARKDLVSAFLAEEFHVRKFGLNKRRAALSMALSRFEPLEQLYQAGMILALSGETTAATRVMAYGEERIREGGIPVPEMLVGRAMVLMMDAAELAPWQAIAKLPVPHQHLRCAPIFPGHTALAAQPDEAAGVRGAAGARDAARRSLLTARKLLSEAAEMGASPLAVHAAQACVAFYLGEPAIALGHQQRAERVAGKAVPKVVTAALKANRALIGFLTQVVAHPAPTAPKAQKSWARRIVRGAKKARAHRPLAAMMKRIALLPKRSAFKPPVRKAPKCRGKRRALGPLKLPATSEVSGPPGTCPKGWTLAHSLPSAQVVRRSGTTTGVTTCRRSDSAGTTWVRVRLPQVMSPPMEAVDMRLRLIDGQKTPLPTFSALACACGEGLERTGITDRGETAWMLSCDALGVEMGLVMVDARGKIVRLVLIDSD
ncbi:MAG: hypothetical protein KC502_13305, partial [Myxococcales bacterium]|nr:hypothetical protein [Myxococcales bacterium]